MSFEPSNFLNAEATQHWSIFENLEHVWEALPKIQPYLAEKLDPAIHAERLGQSYIEEDAVFIGEGTVIEPGAVIKGPSWIGRNCQIRPGAYIRGNVITGDGCVLGNSCEFKNCLLFDGSQVPHFSYVGDSILGQGSHLGAGVICSNLKLHGNEVTIRYGGQKLVTGLRKFGAILGDHAEVGSNAVLNPGSVLGRYSLVYPGVQWRGVVDAMHVAKGTTPGEITPRLDL